MSSVFFTEMNRMTDPAFAPATDSTIRNPSNDLVVGLTSIVQRIDPAAIFPKTQPLEVELGCGDASFLVEYAARKPNHNFIGVERLLGRIAKLERKGRTAGLENLRGVRIESAYFLQWLLPPRSAAALHIYFPDPWPKKKHHRRRLINQDFPRLARNALTSSGRVFLRTDDPDYFAQMQSVFGACEHFREEQTPAGLAGVLTDFERDFNAQGISTLLAAYRVAGNR